MTINNKKMKVLFDSGSSISILTRKGRNIIPPELVKDTRVNVWAANNQKLNLAGEANLIIDLKQPIQHRFLVSENDISGCHALLGTDLFPKLNSFFLAGIRESGASLCMNGTLFPIKGNSKPDSTYIVILDSREDGEKTFFVTSTAVETVNKLLDEDID